MQIKTKKLPGLTTLVGTAALSIAFFGTTDLAAAKNAHQDHNGACARSTTSISKGVSDLKYNGVLGTFAKSLGIKPIDGSLTDQMKNQLAVGKVAAKVTTNNEGCTGHGGTFGAGKRTLYKGESIIVKVPAQYGKDVCSGSHKGCTAVTITVKVALPASCWNRNRGTIKVIIWVKKAPTTTPKPTTTPETPTPPTTPTVPPCSQDANNDSKPQCVSNPQAQTAEQQCKDNGNTWNSQTSQCVVIQNGPCGVVVIGNNNTVNTTGCNTEQTNIEICTANGGSWQNNVCVTTTPPPTTPPTTPPASTPPTVVLDSVQEVNVNGHITIVANAAVPSGHSAKVCFTATYGRFDTTCTLTFTGEGSPVRKTSGYTAPIDVTSDTVTATVYDLTSGLNGADSKSVPVHTGDPAGGRV